MPRVPGACGRDCGARQLAKMAGKTCGHVGNWRWAQYDADGRAEARIREAGGTPGPLMNMYTHASTHPCTHMPTPVHESTCTYTHAHQKVHMHAKLHTHIYAKTCPHTRQSTPAHTCVYTHRCTCMCSSTYTCVHAHAPTHISSPCRQLPPTQQTTGHCTGSAGQASRRPCRASALGLSTLGAPPALSLLGTAATPRPGGAGEEGR